MTLAQTTTQTNSMEWNVFLPVLGIAVGWTLNELSARFRWKREWRRKREEMLLDAYVEWCANMEKHLVDYARCTHEGEQQPPLVFTRLMLLERDPDARRLVDAVLASIPRLDSEEHKDLQEQAHTDPEWSWPPFRKKMDALSDHLRNRMTR
jgi:hypothetical protein